jgi:preprotein translocase subunit SecA
VVLSTIDERWKDHLYDLDSLKASIGFRGWGQKDPLIEYKQEAFDMFVDLMTDIQSSIARLLFRARIETAPPPPPPPQFTYMHGEVVGPGTRPEDPAGTEPPPPPVRPAPPVRGIGVNPMAAMSPPPAPDPSRLTTNRTEEARPQPAGAPKVGRNDPCPCGSGKKYKNCHGAKG